MLVEHLDVRAWKISADFICYATKLPGYPLETRHRSRADGEVVLGKEIRQKTQAKPTNRTPVAPLDAPFRPPQRAATPSLDTLCRRAPLRPRSPPVKEIVKSASFEATFEEVIGKRREEREQAPLAAILPSATRCNRSSPRAGGSLLRSIAGKTPRSVTPKP